MKYFALLCIFLLCIHFSMQTPKYVNCRKQVLTGKSTKACALVTCNGNTGFSLQYCDNSRKSCGSKKQVGYHNGDKYAEYPGCCSYPICQ
uniref:Venom protein n=1 Tax=Ampulex compressa TaxID=860918 RepID=A0A1W6EW40_AMPCP|nr:venom protein [Ampulex compressa]